MVRKYKYYICDFETTVYEGQQYTEVWASALVEIGTEEPIILNSIQDTLDYFIKQKTNIIAYYHNLKFDGAFWLDFLLTKTKYKQACTPKSDYNIYDVEWVATKEMKPSTFKYSISRMGQWYKIIIKLPNNFVLEIRDSLKLLPFSVKKIGKDFHTKHQKLDMEYEGFRYSGCEITEDEQEYIKNDVMVVNEGLQTMFNEGHNSLTIGSCCLQEYKNIIGKKSFYSMFPDLYEFKINEDIFGEPSAGFYIRNSYRGGWCYLVKGKENKIYHNGTTADVNSLYPSVMSGESGNLYPIGLPVFWKGNFIPDVAKEKDVYFFIRIKTEFYIKQNKLPFVQIKRSLRYKATEMLETSDVRDSQTGKYTNQILTVDGNIENTSVTMTLTMTDYYLFLEHYNTVNFEILDGCWFFGKVGIFDEYIEKYKKKKLESKGALREIAKLFLNNLYGKMATNIDSSFKYAYVRDDDSIGFIDVLEFNKKGGYIPVGSAITSYARDFTIRTAQKNYYGRNKRGFIYADTDSIHCDLAPDEIKGIKVHDKNFLCWKLESNWDIGYFIRQKTYIEHIIAEDLQPIENPYYNIKCAGLPQRCKDLFEMSMKGEYNDEDLTEEELEFVKTKRGIEDFKVGLCIPGKLLPKRIKGGVVLVSTTYEMR